MPKHVVLLKKEKINLKLHFFCLLIQEKTELLYWPLNPLLHCNISNWNVKIFLKLALNVIHDDNKLSYV